MPRLALLPVFLACRHRAAVLIWLAMSSVVFVGGGLYAVTGVFLSELFETRVRYSGISFGYQMAGMLAGAPAPIIATALVNWSGGASWPVATYLTANSLITFIAVCLSGKYNSPIVDQVVVKDLIAGQEA